MQTKHLKTRSLATLLIAGVLSLALVAGAGGAIYVYKNNFGSKQKYNDIRKAGGGSKCKKAYRAKSKSMRVSLSGKTHCVFRPPVVGDSSQPNHVVFAKGKVLHKRTPKSLRKHAYLAVRVRIGNGDAYELMVRPSDRVFRLVRQKDDAGLTQRGTSSKIRPPKEPNALRLEAKGGRISAFVNGAEVASFADPNHEQIAGRRVSFGLGSRKNGERRTVGAFNMVRVGLAN